MSECETKLVWKQRFWPGDGGIQSSFSSVVDCLTEEKLQSQNRARHFNSSMSLIKQKWSRWELGDLCSDILHSSSLTCFWWTACYWRESLLITPQWGDGQRFIWTHRVCQYCPAELHINGWPVRRANTYCVTARVVLELWHFTQTSSTIVWHLRHLWFDEPIKKKSQSIPSSHTLIVLFNDGLLGWEAGRPLWVGKIDARTLEPRSQWTQSCGTDVYHLFIYFNSLLSVSLIEWKEFGSWIGEERQWKREGITKKKKGGGVIITNTQRARETQKKGLFALSSLRAAQFLQELSAASFLQDRLWCQIWTTSFPVKSCLPELGSVLFQPFFSFFFFL